MTQESINVTVVIKAPQDPVKEIYKLLPRIWAYMKEVKKGKWIIISNFKNRYHQ